MSIETRIYFGKKFRKQKDGYWANMMPIHAHRWVWINHHGAIPKGMDIHHKDGDKSNNKIENLQMLSRSDHLKEHWKDEELKKERRKQLDLIRPKVHEYLRSEEGRKKQSEISIQAWQKRKQIIKTCKSCNQEYQTYQSWSKFCCSACDMRFRRTKDNLYIESKCPMCHKLFKKEKYKKQIFCSISCGAKNSSNQRKKK